MLVIIGKDDIPVYEANLQLLKKEKEIEINITHHFALHSSLDSVDEKLSQTNNMFLKRVDQSGDFHIYSFVTATNMKFLLLIDERKDERIQNFFVQVYEALVKVMMNPLYEINSPIRSKIFDQSVRMYAKQFD